MMNTRIKKNHMAVLREGRNSRMDEHSDEPQHLDQSKRVL